MPTALSASRIVRARAVRSVDDHWCGRNSLRARALTTDPPGECEHVVRRARRTGGSHHVSFATRALCPTSRAPISIVDDRPAASPVEFTTSQRANLRAYHSRHQAWHLPCLRQGHGATEQHRTMKEDVSDGGQLTPGLRSAMNSPHGLVERVGPGRFADAPVRAPEPGRRRADHHDVLPGHLAFAQAGPARAGVEHDGRLHPDGGDPQPDALRLRGARAAGVPGAVSRVLPAHGRHAGDRAREDLRRREACRVVRRATPPRRGLRRQPRAQRRAGRPHHGQRGATQER